MFGRKQSAWQFAALPADVAKQQLEAYVIGFKQGMSQPLLLLPASGGAWLEACFDEKSGQLLSDDATLAKARGKLLLAWSGNYQVEGEGSDPYLQRLIRQLGEEHIAEITRQATRWLLPLRQARLDE